MNLEAWETAKLYDLERSPFGDWLSRYRYPWEALTDIKAYIMALGATLDENCFEKIGEDVWIAKTATVHPSAVINGPCIIMDNTELRPGCFIRGSVLVGRNCVMGNSCEFKNAVLLEHVQVPHFSYVGDSILGNDVHFGAGVITSNFRQDHGPITIHLAPKADLKTNLRKMGAVIGDGAELGCQAVLNPGSLIGRAARVYPLTATRYALPEHSILKNDSSIHSIIYE